MKIYTDKNEALRDFQKVALEGNNTEFQGNYPEYAYCYVGILLTDDDGQTHGYDLIVWGDEQFTLSHPRKDYSF